MEIATTDLLILSKKQAALFSDDENGYCESLVTLSVPKEILLMGYRRLVHARKLIPLEQMSREQQRAAGEMAKEIAKGRLGRRDLINLVKALLIIEYFLNL